MTSIISYISDSLSREGIIKQDDINIFEYGLECFTISVLEILSVLVLSLFVKNFTYTAIFFMAFIPLRMYAGGYHADTKLRCYVVLLIVYAIFTLLIEYIPSAKISLTALLSAINTVLVILKFSPIINKKKNVNDIEIKNYRIISIVITITQIIILFLLSLIFPDSKYILSFSLGQSAVSLSMIMALVKTKFKEVKFR